MSILNSHKFVHLVKLDFSTSDIEIYDHISQERRHLLLHLSQKIYAMHYLHTLEHKYL